MRLLELELENFRQYAQAVVPFETGITAIVGANGAGKTTLVEAILWALYGANAARGTSDTLRFMWSQGGSRVRVRLDFQLGSRFYQIIRTDKEAALIQIQNGVQQSIARGVRPVTEAVQNLLGMTLNQFQTSFCARQKELEFMSYAPERRREEISRMLGYERIGKALDEIAQYAKQLDAEVAGLQQGLGNRELIEQQIRETRYAIAQCETQIDTTTQQLRTARAELEKANHQLREEQLKKQAYDALQNQAQLLQTQAQGVDGRITQLRTRWEKIQQAKKRLRELQSQVQRFRQLQQRLSELDKLAQSEQQRAALRAHITQLQRQVEQLQAQREELAQKAERLKQLQPVVQQAQQFETQIHQLRQQAAQAAQRAQLEAQRDHLKERVRTLQTRQQEADALAQQIRRTEQHAQQLDAQRTELQATLEQWAQAWHDQRTNAEAKLRTQQTTLAQLQQRQQQLLTLGAEGKCPTCGQPLGDAYQRVLTEVQEAIETETRALHQLQQTLEAIQQEPDALLNCRQQIQQVEQAREAALQQLASLQAQYTTLQAQLNELPTLQAQLDALQAQIEQLPLYDPEQERILNEQLERLRPACEEAQTLAIQLKDQPRIERELRHCQHQLDRYQQQLAQLPEGYNPDEHEQLRQEAEQLRPLYEEALQLKTLLEEERQVRDQIEQTKQEKAAIESQLTQVQTELQSLGFLQEEYEQAEARYREADEQVHLLKEQLASLQAEKQSNQQHLERLQAQLAQIQQHEERLQRKQHELLLHKTLRGAMHAFRMDLNQRLRPLLASYATEFLTHLTGGRYTQLELDEEYRVHLIDDGMRKAVISGGEQDIVNLCMRLALARLITERAGQPLSLLILDEVFGSLDTDRRQNVLMLLNNLRDWFEQILIISHIEDINEAADRTLYVERDERTRVSKVLIRAAEPSLSLSNLSDLPDLSDSLE
ncbi:putative DNA double-strand break repair Rad50 ATPase [bacterium HR15]|nr:putative DNA double-strand break repair Rad50 ATPase [bacterium HR15]